MGLRILFQKYLGDDSHLRFCKQFFDRVTGYREKVVFMARHMFGMELHPDKVKISTRTGDLEFLGYRM